MVSIVAPHPRRLTRSPFIAAPKLFPPCGPDIGIVIDANGEDEDEDPFISHSPIKPVTPLRFTPLLSPVCLHDRARNIISKSPTPCSSIKIPGLVLNAPRSPRRRRHHPRSSCPIQPRNSAVFDNLPWISALSATPDFAANPWDIADLSQLPVERTAAVAPAAPNVGPIRRRRTSLRTHPMSPTARPTVTVAPLVPARDVIATPPPRFPSPSRVQFRNLMPAMTPRPA
ncbi:hypothetical protein OF83DRAFT_1178095 [Amylostereum chailletii]|nr:hypothetical protein OF83DRAFT_1178095 [Amylostereum chailletii]